MSRHNEMPPVPPANRSHKGIGDNAEVNKESPKTKVDNTEEQGDTLTSEHHERRILQGAAGEVEPLHTCYSPQP
jgi:hypothetical protein